MPRVSVASLIGSLVLTGASAAAQTIRIAPATEVAREADPRRFTEPHLAIHPTDPRHLLAAVFIGWVQGSLAESGGGPVVVAASTDRGDTWNRAGVAVGSSPAGKEAQRVMTMGVNGKGVLATMVVERSMRSGEGCLHVEFSAPLDGGATFTAPQVVSTSSCGTSPMDESAARMFPTYGDYFGLVSMPDGTFRLMWPEMRGGRSVLLTGVVDVDGRAAVSAK
jgi:hypothetical protein